MQHHGRPGLADWWYHRPMSSQTFALSTMCALASLVLLNAACGDSKSKSGSGSKAEGKAKPEAARPEAKGAFGKYMAKSKASEAQLNLRKLLNGARAYYLNTPSPGIEPIPNQLPGPKAGPTPPLGECCNSGGKCAPSAEQWTDPVWIALMFSVDNPHYYSYEFTTDDKRQSFTARAIGDLDCDGQYSTFSMTATAGGGDLKTSGTVTEVDPME